MKICAAQTRPVKGQIEKNLDCHRQLIQMSIDAGSQLVVFPELSITGYEPGLAKDLVTTPSDSRLDCLQSLSDSGNITIAAGIPTQSTKGILIGMVIFQPHQPRQLYAKQFLHADELPWFVEGEQQVMIKVHDTNIAPAICYESLLTEHADHAAQQGAKMYVASVAKSLNGVRKAFNHYPSIAGKYAMPVLMANCVGFCDNFDSVGKSSVWNSKGILMGQLDDQNEGILVFDTLTEKVEEKTL